MLRDDEDFDESLVRPQSDPQAWQNSLERQKVKLQKEKKKEAKEQKSKDLQKLQTKLQLNALQPNKTQTLAEKAKSAIITGKEKMTNVQLFEEEERKEAADRHAPEKQQNAG
ncbi:MAG: hypothetical protein Q7R81_03685 [Candidatus Peregrinibacteria bacterium]|nr:hypothetical protein [Candidatus Peregrinibacteria bacterium]